MEAQQEQPRLAHLRFLHERIVEINDEIARAGAGMSKRAALYGRVSTFDQTTANQFLDLRQMAQQRGLEIVQEYVDHGISGTRARRPGA